MSSDNSNLAKKVAIGAAVGCGGALALYYLLKKYRAGSNNTISETSSAELTNATVEELKALGNKLFSEKKFHEAIEIFSRAIEIEEVGSEPTKAMCYQNRAASKEKASGFTSQDCLDDYDHAIAMNPSYGKAYFRRSILLHKEQSYARALTEIFCALHLDPTLEKNVSSLMPLVIEELEKEQHEHFNRTQIRGLTKHVRHERVYAWLVKTVINDPLKRLVTSSNISGPRLAEAVQLINELKFDEVAAVAGSEELGEDNVLEAILLAAKFSAFQNRNDDKDRYLEKFTSLFNKLIEPEQDKKKELMSSMHIIKIETAESKDAILQAFYDAISTDLRNVDYYAMAAFRLVIYGEPHEAMKILMTESLGENTNIQLLRLTLSILANTDGMMDAARLHSAIAELDNFVRSMANPSPYARTLLAKVYSTFSEAKISQELMDEVLKAEPNQSIHYFDRGCMSNSATEAMAYLKKCLEIEPYHAEANLMYASLMLSEFGNRPIQRNEYNELMEYLDKAAATFEGSPDFPVITGVFRLREILKAKLACSERLNLFTDE